MENFCSRASLTNPDKSIVIIQVSTQNILTYRDVTMSVQLVPGPFVLEYTDVPDRSYH